MSDGQGGLSWRRESAPSWSGDLKRIVGGQPAGVFDVDGYVDDQPMIGEWWSASADDGAVLGYGWLDATWGGDAEVSLAVDPAAQTRGVGSFIMSSLEREAAGRGFNYVYNSIRPSHPSGSDLYDWLAVRGYTGSESGGLLRKRVTTDGDVRRTPSTSAGAPGLPEGSRGPGHEESGGYVDVDEHRY
ncbi:GNAT family N-acetyltransferase [Epidermidibacterium keratini]|uniref:GNAT family N-acetyltransferase n=1 Tax=Epidermidibacterium keratini TaxID=1891644 RepID=A0A7L4YP00_9ACTN|nr:GNAT family N-acetyltransferase [Epidermidibacterium keratini]QHC00287.1 GNAT family N-acetyltransferase [Epidermidibacterium keratini]